MNRPHTLDIASAVSGHVRDTAGSHEVPDHAAVNLFADLTALGW